ncbi:MAG: DUF982 domain-containing protein [Agrobacterium sp.]|nr:DUF982 domain-containing protein [Agrobacterium sp.]
MTRHTINVLEAYRHLSEWPATNRDSAHSIALKACGAALRGEIEAETARSLFVALDEKQSTDDSAGTGRLAPIASLAPSSRQDPRAAAEDSR